MKKIIGKIILGVSLLSLGFLGSVNKLAYAENIKLEKSVESQINDLIKEKEELIVRKKFSKDAKEQRELGIRIGEIGREIQDLKRKGNTETSKENTNKSNKEEEINKLIQEKKELIARKKVSKDSREQKELGIKIGEIEREIQDLKRNTAYDNSSYENKPQWLKDKIAYYKNRGKIYRGQADTNRSEVILNGKNKKIGAYKFNDNNYFKLRDLAVLSKDTDSKFNVTWDEKNKAIEIVTDKNYKSVGGELATIKSGKKDVVENISKLYIDGEIVELESYSIEGNNYFKLRDLGDLLGFEVDWDSKTGSVIINM